jgi:hypothetical protein
MRNITISFSAAFKKFIMLVMIAVTAIVQLQAQTYSFTTCGATGLNGPSQTQVNFTYASSSITGVVSNNGIQEWTVPATGLYSIKVAGAKGGGAGGGNGAVLSGEFMLTQGHVIQIVAGQRGTGGFGAQGSINSGGGGGGSFVVNKTTNTILLIAGGGGGGNGDYGSPYLNVAGNPANTGTTGNSTYLGGGGTNGNGGKNGVTNDPAAGGGGYLTNGENSTGTTFATGGAAFVNGARGGSGRTGSYFGGDGGFGGGGGGVSNVLVRGGGGGGYSGGQGGSYSVAQPSVYTSLPDLGYGAGGGSINNGTNQLTYATNAAAGYVTVTTLSTPAGALNFVKTNNNYITVPHSASLNLGAEFTIESWVNYTGVNSTIIDKGDYDYLLQVNCNNPGFSPNKLNFYNRNTGWVHSTGTVPEGTWTHVAVTLKNGTMTFYINGVPSGTAAVNFAQDNGPVNIGRQSPSSCACNIFNGNMDELRVWNRALSACEINSNKSCELSGTQTGLAAYYKFNQGNINNNNSAVNTLTDASGNNNTGTLTNFALTGTSSNWVAGQVSGTCSPIVIPAPVINASGSTTICAGGSVTLTASAGSSYLWSNGATTQSITVSTGGAYTVTVTNASGCSSTSVPTNVIVTTINNQTVSATPVNLCVTGSSTVTLASSQVGIYYTLRNNADNAIVAGPVAGTGAAINFNTGNITATTTYNVLAETKPTGALNFNGTTYVSIPHNNNLNVSAGGQLTMEAWVNPAVSGQWRNILMKGAYGYGMAIDELNRLYFWDQGGGNAYDTWSDVTVPANTWSHVAITVQDNGSNLSVKLYLNGVNVGNKTSPIAQINDNTANLIIGRQGTGCGCNYFNGKLDDVRVWNTVRTASEIAASMNSCLSGSETGLLALYKMDDGNGSIVTDSKSANNGTITGTASWTSGNVVCGAVCSVQMSSTPTVTVLPTPTVNAITNQEVCHNAIPVTAIAFTGSVSGTVYNWTNSNPSIGLAASGTGDIASFLGQNTGTVPVYATITVTPSYTSDGNTCTGTPVSFTIRVNPIPVIDPIANLTVCNGTVTAPFNLSSAVAGSVFKWTQPNNVPYVNVGLPNGDGATVPSFTATNTGTTPITATFYAVSYYSGETMGCGTSRQFDVTVNPTPAATITASGSTTFCTGGAVTLTASSGASYLWSNGAQTPSITVNQSGNYSVVVTSAAGCTNTSTPVTVTVNALPAIPVISSAGSTTVCVGSPVTLSAGGANAGTAIDFDGSNDNIVIPNNAAFNFTSQYTVESWINLRTYQYGTILAKFEDDNNNRGWMVNIGETGAPTVHVVHSRLGTWTNPIQWNSGFQPTLNTWYHIAVVFDASLSTNQIKLYVNGALTAQTSWPYTITPNAANMYIGGYDNPGNGVNGGANGRFFNGRLDEVRVWNVARTAAQISANYNQVISAPQSGLVAAYSFSENSGNAIQDVTGVHNGTMVNNPTRISNGPALAGGAGSNTYLWSTGATGSSIAVNQVGNYSVTVTNENGCSATSAPVTVSNYAMPTISCPANITVASPANQCGANVTYANATVTSGPANPTVTYSHPSGSFFPVGTTTVTITVTDACGKTASCTFTVTVQDVTAPVLGCTSQASATPVNFMRGTSTGGTASIVSWGAMNGAAQYAGSSLGTSCNEVWRPFGTLCDESPNTNSMTTSTKQNQNSGITWNNGGGTGIFIVDLGAAQTFNLAQVYQMFSDGKTTHVRGFYHPSTSATAPSLTDAGWVEMFPETLIGAGVLNGNNVTQPTNITFNNTTARYIRFYARNDGRYGSSGYIETRSIKLFNTAPAVNNVVVTAADGSCTAVATYDVQALDNCSGTVVTYSIPSGSSFPIGSTPVTVTATDASGNVATCSFSVIVNAPEINVTGNANNIPTGTTTTSAADNTGFGGTLPNTPVSKTFVIQNTGTATLKISSIGLSGTDASAFSVTGITLPATIAANASANFNLVFNSNTPGIKNATVTINNGDCNEAVYQFAISAEITCTNPVFVNLNPQVQANTTATTCNAVVSYPLAITGIPAPNVTYVFSGATTGNGTGTGSGQTFNKGITHVVVTAVNPCSTVVNEFDVIVTDNILPIATSQNITVQLDANGAASITAAQINNGSSDNCGIASITVDKTNFDCSNVGANTVTLTVTDVNGNVSTTTATVTVVDNILPIATSQNITVQLNANGAASITAAQINNGSSDNCGIASISVSKTSFDCSNVGANTVTLTVTDVNGNVSTATAVVTVVDNIAPSITAPALVSVVNTAGSCMATVELGTPVTSDNCGVASVTNNAPALFPVGTTIVRWTVTDIHGNVTDTATQEVVVIDNENPTISVNNISVNNDAGKCAAAVQINLPETADNCGVATVMGVRSDNKLLTEDYPVGTTTITWTVKDIHGNIKTVVQTIIVTDNEKPGITAPALVSVVNIPGSCMASVNLGTPVTSDNCGVATVTNNAPALFPVGTTIVRWTVTDIHGNVTDTATQEVVVIDNESPTISVNNISVNNDAGKCAATVAISLPATADNCGVATVMGVRSDDKLLTEEYPVGTTTITWTVRDVNGNIKTATQTIVVTDNEKPVIVCAANQVFCANTGGNTQYTIPVLNQSDNCGIASTTYSITGASNRTGTGTNASGNFAIGTSTVTFTVTDVHGNISTCSFTVTINPLPVASIAVATADALCNQFTLTANSTLSGPFTYQWLYNNNTKATTQQLGLGLTDADGLYSVYTADANGCRSELPATYNYQKQTLVSSYTILGMKEVKLGQYNKVETGSVGVMSSRGEAEFDKYSSVTGAGSFVKAPRIDTDKGVTINSKIYGIASVTLPTMQYNTSNTRYLQDKTINSNVTTTVNGNYDDITLKKGSNVTLTGTVFGKIKLEEGASVRFTSTTIDVEEIQIEKGPKTGGYSYIRFAPNTSIRVSKKVTIGSDVIVNPEAYQVTFYMADNRRDEEKFHVKGDDTRITANIILPDGKLKVTGGNYGDDRCDHRPHSSNSCRHRGHGHHDCDHRGHGDRDCRDDVFMTGLFIAEEVESEGKHIIWNSYNCAPPSAPVTALTSNNNKVSITEEVAASGKLQAANKSEEELKVTVMPNPSSTYFTLKLESKYDAPVTLRVVDAAGRVVESRAKLGSNSTIQVGHNFHAGNYFAELVQGNRRKTIQLIKVR